MSKHGGTSFYNSCVKVPVDPYSKQPIPSYERPRLAKSESHSCTEKNRKINFAKDECHISDSESSSPRETLDSFLEFIESIPDYGQVHHLSNEQFKQKVEYLKRKQRLFLENLRNTYPNSDTEITSKLSVSKDDQNFKIKSKNDTNDLKLKGKKCSLIESRTNSPILFPSGSFNGLAEDQDLLTYRCKNKDKKAKTMRNEEIHSANRTWSTWNDSKSIDSVDSDTDSIETKSLPASPSKEWHPTVPKPFSFTLREEAEKYMTNVEKEEAQQTNFESSKKSPTKKRRVRPIPLTSKIPLYDKLLAEKEERSRMIREESALNLMSQVRPFKLECDRRAWRFLARSSPEIRSKSDYGKFKARPIPKTLFDTDVYDRMLEDEYYRQLKKKIRAAELMKSSSLPPSMARRERVKSALGHFHEPHNFDDTIESRDISRLSSNTSIPFERSKSAMTLSSMRGNNLAAILRCQASRKKLELEIQEQMEEKRREQAAKIRESMIGRNPAWRALRSATRHERERDFSIRNSLRRDEAREQAERHRLQMEMMLSRVTRIPTLFERHSQNYQSLTKMQQKTCSKGSHKKKKKKKKLNRQKSSSTDSYESYGSNSRPNSGSFTSSSGTLLSLSKSSKSSEKSRASEKSTAKSENSSFKKKGERGQLKVSINETAELIEDQKENDDLFSNDCSSSEGHDENTSYSDEHDVEE